MPSYSINVGHCAELNAAEAEACGHLDYLFEQRRGWHQQQPEHAAERDQLPKDGGYGRFFSILQEIANGVPDYTVDNLTFFSGEDAMENTISCEIDRWRHNPPVMREYARVFCRVQSYHEFKRDPTCPEVSPGDIACEILQSSGLGQLTAPSLRCAVLEFMIYGAVLHEKCYPGEVFDLLVQYEPNILATINEAFDNFLDKNLLAYEQNLIYQTVEDDALALGGVAKVASSLWKERLYTSPYAFVLILRISLESVAVLERDFFDEGKALLLGHAKDLREIIVRGDFIWENLRNPRDRARYASGRDAAVNDHLPGGPGGLTEGRRRLWVRSLEGMDKRPWDNMDTEEVLFEMADAEDAFPVREDLIPETYANRVTSMEW
ncbi:hypothetical protein LQW54_007211 [Pestalotiopsis sp. IQ-011]